ncbi:N-acetylmuramoyl-L-alanine amidase family protein [Parasediminibacterium sp. JCM 36343]|uniref:N-acetylmuramoyl-L-alanine amidase family protein n=1 Tax=Parasediminibacterium sp. JCM 36343 TaxID=3374279 RepID=UPI00397CF5E3
MTIRKYTTLLILSFCVLLLSGFDTKDGLTQKSRLRKIVIDPGHGGHDSGAPGKYSNEKDIALAISLRLEQLLRDQIPDIELVVTRRTDIYHSPPTKANIANQAKGDLFICIHCNSADPIRHSEFTGYKTETVTTGRGKHKHKTTREVKQYHTYTTPNPAKGTETYIWGAHKNESKEVAMRENQSLYLDSTTARSVENFDMNSPEKMNFINLKTRQFFDRSAFLALTIQEEFRKAGRINRDALQRQVGIWVLQAVAMPAVLVETGYISNPEEEDYLNSPAGQTEIAQSIVNAIKHYRASIDSKNSN